MFGNNHIPKYRIIILFGIYYPVHKIGTETGMTYTDQALYCWE